MWFSLVFQLCGISYCCSSVNNNWFLSVRYCVPNILFLDFPTLYKQLSAFFPELYKSFPPVFQLFFRVVLDFCEFSVVSNTMYSVLSALLALFIPICQSFLYTFLMLRTDFHQITNYIVQFRAAVLWIPTGFQQCAIMCLRLYSTVFHFQTLFYTPFSPSKVIFTCLPTMWHKLLLLFSEFIVVSKTVVLCAQYSLPGIFPHCANSFLHSFL